MPIPLQDERGGYAVMDELIFYDSECNEITSSDEIAELKEKARRKILLLEEYLKAIQDLE